MTILSMVFR